MTLIFWSYKKLQHNHSSENEVRVLKRCQNIKWIGKCNKNVVSIYITLSTKNTWHFLVFMAVIFHVISTWTILKKKIANVWVIEEFYVHLLNVLQWHCLDFVGLFMLSYHLSLSKYRPNISCNVFTCNSYFIECRLLRFKYINAYYIIFPNYKYRIQIVLVHEHSNA